MTPANLNARDRAGLSAKARDHLHELKTDFKALDVVSLTVDLAFGFLAVVVIAGACVLVAYGLVRSFPYLPEALEGPEKYEMFIWLIFAFTVGCGLSGLYQFWLRRIWVQTYGTRRGNWNGGLATMILLGGVMPLGCIWMLMVDGLLGTWQTAVFAVIAALYLRHALQVYRWSSR
jgi:hypothetical protein